MDRFRGFSGERGPEEGPEREAEGFSLEIDRLLAKLIESGPELDPFYKKQLRTYLHQLLGIFDIKEKGAEGLLEARKRLDLRPVNLPTATSYPSIQEFQKGVLGIVLSEHVRELPEVPAQITASSVAKFAQYEWLEIDGGSARYTIDYLYELGKVMTSRPAYEALFPDSDNIAINQGWQVENGPQRALVLKTLGPSFIAKRKMDSWIKVDNLEISA